MPNNPTNLSKGFAPYFDDGTGNLVVASASNPLPTAVAPSVGFLDSTTPLAANNNVLGAARPTSSYGPYSYFTAFAYADQAGTLYIDWACDGGTTWFVLNSVAVAAATTGTVASPIPAFNGSVSLRARYVNGAVAQTAFALSTSFTAN